MSIEAQVSGEWFEPSATATVNGTLRLGDDWELEVSSGLRPDPPDGDPNLLNNFEVIPVIWGTDGDGDEWSLLDSTFIPSALPAFIGAADTLRPQAVLTGHHLAEDGLVVGFTLATDPLAMWAGNPVLGAERHGDSTLVPTGETVLIESATNGATVHLVASVTWMLDNLHATFERHVEWRVHLDEPQPWRSVVEDHVRPLTDLVSFAVGAYSKITDLHIYPADQPDRPNPLRMRWHDGLAVTNPPKQHEAMFTLPMWNGDPAALLSGWHEARARFAHTLTAILARDRQPMHYVEDRIITAGGLIDTIAPALEIETKEQATPEREAQIARILGVLDTAALDAEDLDFARKALRGRNDRTFRQKFDDVAARAGAVGEHVLDAQAGLGGDLAGLRGGPAHGKSTDRAIEGHWAAEAARWIVCSVILREIGFDPSAVDTRIVSQQAFQRCLLGLRTGD
ncbi:MAG: hypothetical protein U0Q22_15575 [Acidimicrobiales bacterium]